MEQSNLDAMFEDMLGELDIISQQLEDSSEKQERKPNASLPQENEHLDSESHSTGYENADDIDLSSMLNDLTDWQHTLQSSQGQMLQGKSASLDSGIGFNGNSLPRNASSIESSPQFNTLKRPTNSEPSVTFENINNLSLGSLEKEIENDKRSQDKARQLTPEELAALSPVMQELDDLVTDLSNLSFQKELSESITVISPKPVDNKLVNKFGDVADTTHASSMHGYPDCSIQDNDSSMSQAHSILQSSQVQKPPHMLNKHGKLVDTIISSGHQKATVSNKHAPPLLGMKPKLPQKPHSFMKCSQSATSPINNPQVQVKSQARIGAPPNLSKVTPTQSLQQRNSLDNEALPSSNKFNSNKEMITMHRHSSSKIRFQSDEKITNSHSKSHSDQITATISESLQPLVMSDIPNTGSVTSEEREERIRAEKMRIALEKLKEARIQKLVVKVFNKDDSSKTLVVDERMTVRSVIKQLLEKNHYEPSINWALIEEIPSLFMERIFEEHESVTEMLCFWTRDTTNQVRFLERKDKYALFRNPQHYLLSTSDVEGQMAERQKQTLLEEFFSGRSGTGVPEVQGVLYIKGDSKSWSRKYCILRTSGLYCSKSGEPKKGKKVSELQCLVIFEQFCVYLGRGWKKKYKSPTDYGFALKHPAVQTKSKHIKYFCCEDVRSLMRWIVGIRCAKYGKQLKENFDQTNDEIKTGNFTPMMQFDSQPSTDSVSTLSTDSNDIGSTHQSSLPQANLTNVFEGAWQRANQQENFEATNVASMEPNTPIWEAQHNKSSNWWDLSSQKENDNSSGTDGTHIGSLISNRKSSDSSSDTIQSSRTSDPLAVPAPHFHQAATLHDNVPSIHPSSANKRIPASPFAQHMVSSPLSSKQIAPPPPPVKPDKRALSPRTLAKPQMCHGPEPPPPPPVALKPTLSTSPNFQQPPDDDLPPPPPDDFLPPMDTDLSLPPMDILPPPPPMKEDFPLPPSMEQDRGFASMCPGTDQNAPVRLPFPPMFKSGQPFQLRHPFPKKGDPPPPPRKNFNFNNNKPPLLPRDKMDSNPTKRSHHITNHHTSLRRIPSNPNYRPPKTSYGGPVPQSFAQAPLTQYYKDQASQSTSQKVYSKEDFPSPPEFIRDLQDSINRVNHDANQDNDDFGLPPPPPELLLNEVKSCIRAPLPPPKSAKPAPTPPKRSPSTKLSIKKK